MAGWKVGSQRPTWSHVGRYSPVAGNEAIELYRTTGRELDPWQQLCVRGALAETRLAAPVHFEVGIIVGRQNGKGEVIECAELSWLFLPSVIPVRLISHSAHLFSTSRKAFKRMEDAIESNPDLDRQVSRINRSHGEEGIELRNKSSLEYRTRSGTGGGGRGLTGDKIVFDEAMILDSEDMADLLPTLATRPGAQVWYTGSAGSKHFLTHSTQLARVRRQARAKEAGVAFWAWEAPDNTDPHDKRWWYRTNPALGIRISEQYVRNELRILGSEGFCRERLGIGDYPAEEGWLLFDPDVWQSLHDPDSFIVGRPAIGIDISPDRKWATVSACGFNTDGFFHVERIKGAAGVRWIVPFIKGVVQRQNPCVVVVAKNGQSRGLIRELGDEFVEAYAASGEEVSEWCGEFYTMCQEALSIRHPGQEAMLKAVGAAVKKEMGNRFVWNQRDTTEDMTPLYSGTLALGGLLTHGVRDEMPLVASA